MITLFKATSILTNQGFCFVVWLTEPPNLPSIPNDSAPSTASAITNVSTAASSSAVRSSAASDVPTPTATKQPTPQPSLNTVLPETRSTRTVTIQVGEKGLGLGLKQIKKCAPASIKALAPGGAAMTAGALVGDIILSVNGISVVDLSVSEIGSLVKGSGDVVELTVQTFQAQQPKVNNPKRFCPACSS